MTLPPLSAHVGDYVCLVLGFGMLGLGLVTLWDAWGTQRWPSTRGRILTAATTETADDDGKPLFQVRATYEYDVGGTLYRGNRVSPGPHTFGRLFTSASEAIGGRAEGHTCLVYYDPSSPARAVLSPGPTMSHYAVTLVGALFVAITLKDLLLAQG